MTTPIRCCLLLFVFSGAACPQAPAETDTQAPDTGSTSTGSATDPSTGTTEATPTTGAEPTTSAATTAPAPACGDGELDDGEACDDGNAVNGDGCNADCTPSGALLAEFRGDTRGTDIVYGVAVGNDGDIVVGGLGTGLSRWVARFDGALTEQWSQHYDIASRGSVQGVALAGGAIYAAGSVETAADGHDTWLARLSLDGAIEWQDSVSSGFGDDYLTEVAVVGAGGPVVAGFVTGADGLTTLWASRYAVDGAAQWTSSFPLGVAYKIYPLGPGLAVTSDAVVVGYSRPADPIPELLVGFPLSGGDPLWTRELENTHGVVNAIAVNDPGLVLAGKHDFAELMVRQTTGTGDIVWSSNACTGSNGRGVAVDSQGDIVAIGDGPGATGGSIRLCKFAADGTLRWGKDIDGGFGPDFGHAVAIDAADRIVAGGAMASETQVHDPWVAVFSP